MPRGVVALTEARSIRERLNVAAKVENAPTEAVGDDAPEAFAMAGTDGVKTAAADGGKAADGVKAVENKDGVDNVSKTAENGAVPSGKRGDFSAPADAAPKDQRDAAADTAPPLQEAAQEAANIDPTRANEAAKDVKVEAAEASCPIPTLHLPFDETLDTDEIIESEFYDTRQQFLNLCQGPLDSVGRFWPTVGVFGPRWPTVLRLGPGALRLPEGGPSVQTARLLGRPFVTGFDRV